MGSRSTASGNKPARTTGAAPTACRAGRASSSTSRGKSSSPPPTTATSDPNSFSKMEFALRRINVAWDALWPEDEATCTKGPTATGCINPRTGLRGGPWQRPVFIRGLQLLHWVKSTGKVLAIVEDYTYYCSLAKNDLLYWRCTRDNTCRAHFTSNKSKKIYKFNFVHNHQPPSFLIRNGVCIKL